MIFCQKQLRYLSINYLLGSNLSIDKYWNEVIKISFIYKNRYIDSDVCHLNIYMPG